MAVVNSSRFDFRDIQVYLNEYSREVDRAVEQTISQVAKEAARKLKDTSPKKTGKYAKGWASKRDTKYNPRIGARHYIVYGKNGTYQKAHLLEHGHAKRNGGRTKAIVHIAPVEDWAIFEAENRIMEKIEMGV